MACDNKNCQCCLVADYDPADYDPADYQTQSGLLTKSDDGTTWLIKVDNNGNLMQPVEYQPPQ